MDIGVDPTQVSLETLRWWFVESSRLRVGLSTWIRQPMGLVIPWDQYRCKADDQLRKVCYARRVWHARKVWHPVSINRKLSSLVCKLFPYRDIWVGSMQILCGVWSNLSSREGRSWPVGLPNRWVMRMCDIPWRIPNDGVDRHGNSLMG